MAMTDEEKRLAKNARQREYQKKTADEAGKKYARENFAINLKFHRINDADVIAKLTSVKNRQGYIRKIIQQDEEIFKNCQ